MNILFIGKRFYTNRDALEERYGRTYQLPSHWAKSGIKTTLWLIDYHTNQRERRDHDHLQIENTPIRGISWVTQFIRVLITKLQGQAPSHIIASGDAYIGLLGWLLARLTGAFFVFDVYDKYDEFSGYRRPMGWDLFNFLLRTADQCWFASHRLLEQIGNLLRKDTLIMNGIDTNRFRPQDKAAARKRLNLPEHKPLVGYFGSMEPDRGVSDLISAFVTLREQGINLELVLAGRKDPATPIPNEIWLHYLGNLPFDDIPQAYAAIDVFAIPYRRSEFMDSGASNKIAEAVFCFRPLAITKTPNLTDNFPEIANALIDRQAAPASPNELARVITLQLEKPIMSPLPKTITYSTIAEHALDALIELAAQPRHKGMNE